jgi:hypothetical protein
MRKSNVGPLKAKTTTRPLKKEGASVENDDRTLETINEDETSLPEVTGEIRDKADQPDDDAIITSFNPHQEAFLKRLLKKAGYAMGHEHLLALQKHQEELQDLQQVIKTMQNKQEQTPIKLPTMMETPRTPRIQVVLNIRHYRIMLNVSKSNRNNTENGNNKNKENEIWHTHQMTMPISETPLSKTTLMICPTRSSCRIST